MVAIDYMAHQEQYSPSRLLEFAELAEHAGFASGWLAAAGEHLDIPVGTCVTPAGEDYHPGLMAQAFATLQELNEDRVEAFLQTDLDRIAVVHDRRCIPLPHALAVGPGS